MTGFVIFVVVMIVVSLISKAMQQSAKANRAAGGTPNPRVQNVIERIQSEVQNNGGPPLELGPKYTKYLQSSAQSAPIPPPSAQQPQAQYQSAQYQPAQQQPVQYQSPGQYQPAPFQPAQSQPPQHQTPRYQTSQYQPPAYQPPPYQPPPAHRPPHNSLPRPNQDIDAQVRELMNAGHDVAAIRLLCDERDLGILEAQEYARALVAPAKAAKSTPTRPSAVSEPQNEDENENGTRYAGSAAFAESIFDLDRDEDVWASGWVDTPEPEDRTDIEELWQTVSNPPRPGGTPPN
jgi:hypothetical protein